jgi:hypothetical protein
MEHAAVNAFPWTFVFFDVRNKFITAANNPSKYLPNTNIFDSASSSAISYHYNQTDMAHQSVQMTSITKMDMIAILMCISGCVCRQ